MHEFSGVIEQGAGQARGLGAATINLSAAKADEVKPGVYAAEVTIEGQVYNGVAFIGKAYLLEGAPQRLEAHLFDFDGTDLTGKEASIKLLKYLRNEMPFTSEEQAKEIIAQDVKQAQAFFS